MGHWTKSRLKKEVNKFNEMLTAKEAKEKTLAASKSKANDEVEKLSKLIEKAALNGNTSIYLSYMISDVALDKLKELGYKASSYSGYDQRDGDSYTSSSISWA